MKPNLAPHTPTESILSELAQQLTGPRGYRAELERLSGVPEPSLRQMASGNWRPKSIDNLIKVERALLRLAARSGAQGGSE